MSLAKSFAILGASIAIGTAAGRVASTVVYKRTGNIRKAITTHHVVKSVAMFSASIVLSKKFL